MIRGIDLSAVQNRSYPQGRLPWPAMMLQGNKFAYIRCGVGNNTKFSSDKSPDSFYSANVDQSEGLIKRGAYHFLYPLPHIKPEDQAEQHVALTGNGGHLDLPTMADLEWPEDWEQWGCSVEQILDWTLAYLAEYEHLTFRKCGLYTYPDFWRRLNHGRVDFAAYPLWCADYKAQGQLPVPGDGEKPVHPWVPWAGWSVWQYTGGGAMLPGGVPVDGDVIASAGDMAQLLQTGDHAT